MMYQCQKCERVKWAWGFFTRDVTWRGHPIRARLCKACAKGIGKKAAQAAIDTYITLNKVKDL